MTEITLKGKPVNTYGSLPEIGSPAPDFLLTGTDFKDFSLSEFRGRNLVLNIFVSVETPVCAESVRRFNNAVTRYENTEVLCISRDLPFAHVRFNTDEGIENVISLSELRSMDFGRDYGLRMTDGSMAGLLARAIVIADKEGKVVYTQLVPEVTEEPDYDNALNHLEGSKIGSGQAAVGGTTVSYDAEVCAKAPEFSEHHRFSDDDEACDDGRSGRI
ncbi:MAG TPA: thiol peroxidase [Halalkalibaculum sp.]|nr:thiol peroxidase [Halalkalibaculum sp.]